MRAPKGATTCGTLHDHPPFWAKRRKVLTRQLLMKYTFSKFAQMVSKGYSREAEHLCV